MFKVSQACQPKSDGVGGGGAGWDETQVVVVVPVAFSGTSPSRLRWADWIFRSWVDAQPGSSKKG